MPICALFHPAHADVWRKFSHCSREARQHARKSHFRVPDNAHRAIVPDAVIRHVYNTHAGVPVPVTD